MSPAVRQALVICAGGVVLASTAIVLVRRRLITLRYAMGWITIGLGGILGGLLSPLVKPLSKALGMSATGLLLAVASCTLVAITVLLSMAASKLHGQVRELAEAHALLERRFIDELAERAE